MKRPAFKKANCNICRTASNISMFAAAGFRSFQDERHGFTQSPIIFIRQFWKLQTSFMPVFNHVSRHDERWNNGQCLCWFTVEVPRAELESAFAQLFCHESATL